MLNRILTFATYFFYAMWLFKDEDDMFLYVLAGLSRIGGDMLSKTLIRLTSESQGQHKLLALENALKYSLDKAGHIFMEHLGREKAKEGAQLPIPLRKNLNQLSLSNCPLPEAYQDKGLKPTQSYLCSICKGYVQAYGESLGMGKLLRVSLLQDGTCNFFFGGEEDGLSQLQAK